MGIFTIEFTAHAAFEGEQTIRIHCVRAPAVLETSVRGRYGQPADQKRTLRSDEYDELVRHLGRIRLPLSPEFVLGVDGVSCELRVEAGMNSCVFRWWGELPRQWSELAEFVEFLHGLR